MFKIFFFLFFSLNVFCAGSTTLDNPDLLLSVTQDFKLSHNIDTNFSAYDAALAVLMKFNEMAYNLYKQDPTTDADVLFERMKQAQAIYNSLSQTVLNNNDIIKAINTLNTALDSILQNLSHTINLQTQFRLRNFAFFYTQESNNSTFFKFQTDNNNQYIYLNIKLYNKTEYLEIIENFEPKIALAFDKFYSEIYNYKYKSPRLLPRQIQKTTKI